MLISTYALISVVEEDLRSAVRQTFELVEQNTPHQEQTTINLTLSVEKDFRILRTLAMALPKEARGFSFFALNGKNEKLTAEEFLDRLEQIQVVTLPRSRNGDPVELIRKITRPDVAVFATYQGCITDYLAYASVKPLLLRLLDELTDMRQVESLWLSLDRIAWKGLLPEAKGALSLMYEKRNKPKTRFRIQARLECKGTSAKEASIVQMVQDVAEQTQIPFDSRKLYARSDPDDAENPTLEELLPIDVAFQEAAAQATAEIGALNLDWRGLPGLLVDATGPDAYAKMGVRIADMKPNVPVRNWFKAQFPEWKSVTPQNEWLRFRKPLDDYLDMLLTFEFEQMQRQRAFTLQLGVEIKAGKFRGWLWKVSLFTLFQRTLFFPCWSFATREELEAALPAMTDLLHHVLPILEARLREWLAPLPTEIGSAILQRGAVTAQEVYQEALMYAKLWCVEAKLDRIFAGHRSIGEPESPTQFHLMNSVVSGIDFEGRLYRLGYWQFCFSGKTIEAYHVKIPSIGSPQCGAYTNRYSVPGVLEEGWIDSDEAFRIAETQGGYEAREQATRCFRVLCYLRHSCDRILQPHWEVNYLLMSERGREDFKIAIDAYTGQTLHISRET